MANTKKVDRRIQRTRNLLRDALMRLIIAKGYDDITIQDITDEANVARTTFYLHFTDKDELLFNTMRDVYEELYSAVGGEIPKSFFTDDPDDCPAEDFIHVQEYADFYRIMLGKGGSAAFLQQVRDYLATIMGEVLSETVPDNVETRVPKEMMGYVMAGAEIGVIKWWLDNGMQESPQEIAFMFEQLMKRGLTWGLNLSED